MSSGALLTVVADDASPGPQRIPVARVPNPKSLFRVRGAACGTWLVRYANLNNWYLANLTGRGSCLVPWPLPRPTLPPPAPTGTEAQMRGVPARVKALPLALALALVLAATVLAGPGQDQASAANRTTAPSWNLKLAIRYFPSAGNHSQYDTVLALGRTAW